MKIVFLIDGTPLQGLSLGTVGREVNCIFCYRSAARASLFGLAEVIMPDR